MSGQSTDYQEFLRNADVKGFLHSLGPQRARFLLDQIEHFTTREAEHRDEIVLEYFGKRGVEQIVSMVSAEVLYDRRDGPPDILDVGAGIGTFTIPIAENLRTRTSAMIYGMDVTPSMLRVLVRRAPFITPIIGIAENIRGSVLYWKDFLRAPQTFDIIMSVLTLHHCPDIDGIFRSLREALNGGGKVVLVDLCKHPFTEFREEMKDYHLGFEPSEIERAAKVHFESVKVKKVPGICCSSSGRCAELFISTMAGED